MQKHSAGRDRHRTAPTVSIERHERRRIETEPARLRAQRRPRASLRDHLVLEELHALGIALMSLNENIDANARRHAADAPPGRSRSSNGRRIAERVRRGCLTPEIATR